MMAPPVGCWQQTADALYFKLLNFEVSSTEVSTVGGL